MTIRCPHRNNGKCDISSKLIKLDVPLDDKACIHCIAHDNPRSENLVTIGRAIITLRRNNLPIPKEIVDKIKPTMKGPGTELKKLVSWFVWSDKVRKCKTCASREQRMNRWGPDTCQKNMLTIIGWLRESAMKNGYPFSERVAAALIRKAIENSRKQ